MSVSRPPELDLTELSDDQKRIHDEILSGPRGIVEGPLRVWLQSPGLADRAQALGAFCRYGTALPERLSELAILVTGAYWRSGFEWAIHCPIALKAGLTQEQVDAIRLGQRPRFDDEETRIIYDVAHTLHRKKRIDPALYNEAVETFGVVAVVDLIGILGYYTLISMTINAFEVPVPAGETEPFEQEGS